MPDLFCIGHISRQKGAVILGNFEARASLDGAASLRLSLVTRAAEAQVVLPFRRLQLRSCASSQHKNQSQNWQRQRRPK